MLSAFRHRKRLQDAGLMTSEELSVLLRGLMPAQTDIRELTRNLVNSGILRQFGNCFMIVPKQDNAKIDHAIRVARACIAMNDKNALDSLTPHLARVCQVTEMQALAAISSLTTGTECEAYTTESGQLRIHEGHRPPATPRPATKSIERRQGVSRW